MKYFLFFIVFLITVAINTEDNLLARIGLDSTLLQMTLLAIIVTGLITDGQLLLLVIVAFMSLCANMPADFMLNFGIDRDIFTGFLLAIIITPSLVQYLDI